MDVQSEIKQDRREWRVAVAESSTPRLIRVHGKPGLRRLSPSHLVS
jgi:hypothetical protein